MAKNPLIRPRPRPSKNFNSGQSKGILDDYAVRKVVHSKEGTMEKVPVNAKDIVNKEYVDSEIVNLSGALISDFLDDHPHQDVNTTAGPYWLGDVGIGKVPASANKLDIYSAHASTTGKLALNAINIPTVAGTGNQIGAGTQTYSVHSTGNIPAMYGYFGGATQAGNGNAGLVIGVAGSAAAGAAVTSTITLLAGGSFVATAGSATVGDVISLGASAPTGTGTITRSKGLNIDGGTAGTTNWAATFCDGDVQVCSNYKLLLEGTSTNKGDTYLVYDSANSTLDTFVGNTEVMNASSTVVDIPVDLTFTGSGSGLPYGSCYGDHIGWSQAAAAQNTWYNISDADMVDGELNLITHDSSGKLTVLKAGRYLINYSITWEDNIANDHTEVGIEITGSGSANAAGITHSETKFANEEQTQSGTAIISLAANATIEIAIRTTDAATPTITVQDLNITAVMVGG